MDGVPKPGAEQPHTEPLVDLDAAERFAKRAKWTEPTSQDHDTVLGWLFSDEGHDTVIDRLFSDEDHERASREEARHSSSRDGENPVYEDHGARWGLVGMVVLCVPLVALIVLALVAGVHPLAAVLLAAFSAWTGVYIMRLAAGACSRAELDADILTLQQFRRTRRVPIADITRIRTRSIANQYGITLGVFYVVEFASGEAVLDERKGGRDFANAVLRAAPMIKTKGWTPTR